MAQTVGELQIVMSANMARLANDMNQAKGMVDGAMNNISRSVATATAALGALGITLGAAMFVRLVKNSLEAQDALSKLSQKVGVSVESLAGLQHAANMSGVSVEGLQKGLKTLATQMFDAQSGLLESKRNFAALGVQITTAGGTLKATDALMIEVADKFAGMADGAAKTALAVKLFGKAGLDMIPMLNEGSAAIAAMVAEGQRLNPVTAESAKQAEVFNDNMTRLSGAVSSVGISIVNNLLPGLSKVSVVFAEAAVNSGNFWKTLSGFALTSGSETENPAKAIDTITQSLISQRAQLDSHRKSWMSWYFADDIALLLGAITANEAKLSYLTGLRKAEPGQTDPISTIKRSVKLVDDAAEKAAKNAAKKELDEYLKRFALLEADSQRRIDEQVELNKYLDDIQNKKMAQDEKDLQTINAGFVKFAEQQIEDYEDYLNVKAKLDQDATKKQLDELKKREDEAKKQFDDISKSLTDALLRGFEGGKGFVQNFRDSLVNMFRTLVLRPIIQPIAQAGAGLITGALGSLGIPGSANASGGGIGSALSTGSNLSSLFGGGGGIGASIFGSSAAYGAALGTTSIGAGSQAAMLAAQTGVFGGAGLSATGTAAGSAMAGLSTALPYIGLALAAYSVLKKDKGGPASFTGLDVSGTAGIGGISSSNFIGNANNGKRSFSFQSFDHGASAGINDLVRGAFTDMRALADKLGLDKSRLDGVQTSFGFRVTDQAAGTGGPSTQHVIDAFGRNLGQVTDQLANALMPNLKSFAQANESATETLVRMVQVQEQLRATETQMKDKISGAVRGLAGSLGITGLQGAVDAQSISEFRSPLDRLSSARGLLDSTFQSGMGGDLSSVNAFPQLLQQALTIGREVGASGPAFQSLFLEGNRQLNELLGKQQTVQADILKNVDMSIREMATDQIGELRRGFAAMVDELTAVRAELSRIRQAA